MRPTENLSDAQRKLLELRLKGRSQTSAVPRAVVTPRPSDAPRLASIGQRRIWFLHQLDPDSPSYNITSSFRIAGLDLDFDHLEHAINCVVRRQEVLRSSYHAHGDQVAQRVHERLHVPLERVHADPTASEDELAEELFRQPFDPEKAPMLRIFVITKGGKPALLTALIHDLIFDKWSLGVFWREVAAYYNERDGEGDGTGDALPPLQIQYADFAHWQRKWLQDGILEKQLPYWRKKLSDLPPPLSLPVDRPYPASIQDSGRLAKLCLSRNLTASLKALAASENASLFTMLLLGWKVLLQRHTGESDLVVGSPVANRRFAETTQLIGFFLSTVALRTDLSGDPPLLEALSRVRQTSLAALEHQDTPLDRIVEEVRPPRVAGRHPLFQVMFVFQREDEAAPRVTLRGETMEPVYIETRTSKFDLTLFAAESGDGMELLMEYRTDLFDHSTIERMLARFDVLLNSMVSSPDSRLSRLDCLTEADHLTLKQMGWGEERPTNEKQPAVDQLVRSHSRDAPARLAIMSEGTGTSYGELEEEVQSIAAEIKRLLPQPGKRVAILAKRSARTLAGLLGAMRAGATYVPIDPAYPSQRCRSMMDDAQVELVLIEENDAEEYRELLGERRTLVLGAPGSSGDLRLGSPEVEPDPEAEDTAAYMIYTSGSTGGPKGVLVSRANLAFSTQARNAVYHEPPGTYLLVPSFSFDSSVAGIFWTLCTGGTLVLPNEREQGDPALLHDLIRKHEVTTVLCTPSLYGQLLSWCDSREAMSSLRTAIVAGEACPPALVRDHFRLLPGCALHNEYGPTEATVWSTVHTCAPRDGTLTTVPIGRPIPGSQVHILDEFGSPTPPGTAGELAIGGQGVSLGYHRREKETRDRFRELEIPQPGAGVSRVYLTGDRVRWNRRGLLEFLGREDEQVKVRGYRIEPGEIEGALSLHPALQRVAVVAQSSGEAGHQRLAAYYETDEEDPEPSSADLRAYLARSLPGFLIPSSFVRLTSLPLTPSGKLDRLALVSLASDSTEAGEKSSATGNQNGRASAAPLHVVTPTPGDQKPARGIVDEVTSIWEGVLGRKGLQPHDDFYDLGGDSILAIQIVSRASSAGLPLTLADFFGDATIAGMASRFGSTGLAPGHPDLQEPKPRRNVEASPTTEAPSSASSPTYPHLHESVECIQQGSGCQVLYTGIDAKVMLDKLPKNTPLMWLKKDGVDSEIYRGHSIEQQVDAFEAGLSQLDPNQPVVLLGVSYGAILTFELTRRLRRRQNSRVDLILLAPSPPQRRDGPNLDLEAPPANPGPDEGSKSRPRSKSSPGTLRRMSNFATRNRLLRKIKRRGWSSLSPKERWDYFVPEIKRHIQAYRPVAIEGDAHLVAGPAELPIACNNWRHLIGGECHTLEIPNSRSHLDIRDPEQTAVWTKLLQQLVEESDA